MEAMCLHVFDIVGRKVGHHRLEDSPCCRKHPRGCEAAKPQDRCQWRRDSLFGAA